MSFAAVLAVLLLAVLLLAVLLLAVLVVLVLAVLVLAVLLLTVLLVIIRLIIMIIGTAGGLETVRRRHASPGFDDSSSRIAGFVRIVAHLSPSPVLVSPMLLTCMLVT